MVNRFDYAYSDAAHPDQRSSETVTNGAFFTFPQNELTRYEHNSLNQLIRTTAPEKLFTYDDAGNMTKGYTPDGYQFAGTYDAENRLASIEYTDSGSTVHKAEYIYSGYGFLSQIKKYENSNPAGDTRIMRSGYLAIQERDAGNQVVREYTWGLNMGGGIGGLLNMRQSGNDYKYLYDGKGNVSALLNTSQQVAASYRYDSFGNLMAKTGTLDQPFGFSTKRYDAGTGLSYYGYRFYAPTIGKWLTRDPLGEAGGINLYGFVLNDPVNWVDPWGLFVKHLFEDKLPSWLRDKRSDAERESAHQKYNEDIKNRLNKTWPPVYWLDPPTWPFHAYENYHEDGSNSDSVPPSGEYFDPWRKPDPCK